jgi:O-antigen/teichoic acid export membrane protein
LKIRRDLLIIGGGRIATALLGLVAIRAVTTLLSPEQFGQLALLVVVQTFCGLLLVNPVGQHINRHTHEWWEAGTLFSRLTDYRKYIFIVSLIGGLVTIWVTKDLSLLQVSLAIFAMVIMINSSTWNATYIPILNMVGQRGVSVSWSLVTSIIALLASVFFCFIWPSSVTWFIGQAIGFSIGALGASLMLRHGVRPKQDNTSHRLLTFNIITTYCLPLALGAGLMWLQLSGYRIVVEYYWGLTVLGFLALGFALANQIWALTESLVQQFLYPFFYKRIAIGDKQSSNQTIFSDALSDLLNVVMPIYVVLIGITFISAPYLLKLLVAPQYASAEVYVKLGIILEFCRVAANLLSSAAQVTKKTKSIIWPYAIGALTVMVMLTVIGEYQYSIIWAAIGLTIAALVMLTVMWFVMLRELKFHPDYKTWFVAILMMFMFILPTYWLPQTFGFIEAGVVLMINGLFGILLLALLFRNNNALQRLVTVELNDSTSML